METNKRIQESKSHIHVLQSTLILSSPTIKTGKKRCVNKLRTKPLTSLHTRQRINEFDLY